MCPDAKILKEILKSERANGWMGQTWLPPTSLSLSLFSDFAQRAIHLSTRSNAIFFDDQRLINRTIHADAPPFIIALSYWRPGFLVTIFCSKSTCNRQTHCVIGLSSPSHISPLLSGQDDPETAQWHVGLYIKKAFVKDDSAPALFLHDRWSKSS